MAIGIDHPVIQGVLKLGFFVLIGVIMYISLPGILKRFGVKTKAASDVGNLLLALFVALGGINGYMTATTGSSWFALPSLTGQSTPAAIQSGGTTPQVLLTSSPTIQLRTVDKYLPGTAVVTQNTWRFKGADSRTDIAGTASISTAPPGSVIEIVYGIDSDDEAAEPYGPIVEHTVEYLTNYEIVQLVANDALATDLSAYWVNDQGQPSTNITIGAGAPVTAQVVWTGSYREDFGNMFCGKNSNVIIAHYNNSEFDDVKLVGYDAYTGDVRVHNSIVTTGFSDKAFKAPVLESSEAGMGKYTFDVWIDPDNTVNPASAGDDITLYYYDSALYLDNEDNTIKCGIGDENGSEIGAEASDLQVIEYL